MHGRAGYQAALIFAVLLGASTGAAQESAPAALARESVLYRFRGGQDASVPLAGLVIDGHGTLFGTTMFASQNRKIASLNGAHRLCLSN